MPISTPWLALVALATLALLVERIRLSDAAHRGDGGGRSDDRRGDGRDGMRTPDSSDAAG